MKSQWSGSDFSEDDIWQGGKVDRLLLKTISALSLKAQISGGKAASVLATRWRQRVPTSD